jgi:hypothetical protein
MPESLKGLVKSEGSSIMLLISNQGATISGFTSAAKAIKQSFFTDPFAF